MDDQLQQSVAQQLLLLDSIETQVWCLTDVDTYGIVNKAHADFLHAPNGQGK